MTDGVPITEPLPREFFFVWDQPYCVWSTKIREDNETFLGSINSRFFESFAKQQARRKLDSPRVRPDASILCRLIWHQAVETFVTLVGATMQAPNCVHAYFSKCRNDDVREIAHALLAGEALPFFNVEPKNPGWRGYFEVVFDFTDWRSDQTTIEFFTRFTEELVHAFISEAHHLEYNALKHGLRVSMGPATLSIGGNDGSLDSKDAIALHAADSSHLLVLKPANGLSGAKARLHQQVERVMLGWDLERTLQDIHTLAMAIANARSTLRCILGAEPGTQRFSRPSMDDQTRAKYFSKRPQLLNFNMREGFTLNAQAVESADAIKRFARKKVDQARATAGTASAP